MDLQPRYLAWVNMLMFVLGVGLAFQAVGLWADPKAEENDSIWESRLEQSTPTGADLSITAAVLNAFRLDEELNTMPISVTTSARVVVLSGSVDEQAKKDRAAELAEGVGGVTELVNRIAVSKDVKPRPAPEFPRARR